MHKTNWNCFLTYNLPNMANTLWIITKRRYLGYRISQAYLTTETFFFLIEHLLQDTCRGLENTDLFYWVFYGLSGWMVTPSLKSFQAKIIAVMLYITEPGLLSPMCSYSGIDQFFSQRKCESPGSIQPGTLLKQILLFSLANLETILCLADCQSIWLCL